MLSASKFSHLPGGSIHAGLNSVAVFEQLHSLHLAWIRLASTRAASVACNCPKPEPFKKWRFKDVHKQIVFPFTVYMSFCFKESIIWLLEGVVFFHLPSWDCHLLPAACGVGINRLTEHPVLDIKYWMFSLLIPFICGLVLKQEWGFIHCTCALFVF